MPARWFSERRPGRRSETRLGTAESATHIDGMEVQPLDGAARRALLWVRMPAGILLVGSIWVLISLFTNARFRVTDVAIEGARLVRRQDVLQVADVTGDSIFRVRAGEIERRLEAGSGLIEDATVRCSLPNQVLIALVEREATLIWESGGRYWWIGADGTVLGPTTGAGTMPVLHDIRGYSPEPDGHIAGVPWALAHDLWEALPAIEAFDYTSEHGLVLYVTTHEWPVFLGHQGDARLKVALLWTLVERLTTSGINVEYIDLRNEARPTFKAL